MAAWKKHKPICDIFAETKKKETSEKKVEEKTEEVEKPKPTQTLIEELD